MKKKMRKKFIAFMLCMVLVICNGVSILADTPAPEAVSTQQVKETKAAPEVETTTKKEETTEAVEEAAEETTTEKKEETTEATTEETTEAAEETTTETKEGNTKATTEAAEKTSVAEGKDETSEASEKDKKENKEATTTEEKDETAPTELTYENDDVIVTVSEVAKGAIPEGAELKVVPILKNDTETKEQYEEVEKQIQEKAAENKTEIKGFLAYDISFVDKDGNELEPNSEVKVTIDYKQAAMPEGISEEDAKDAEVSVMHLEEDTDGKVSQVVDMGKSGKIDALKTTNEKKIEKLEVKTESFSYYTIVWSYNWGYSTQSFEIHYVDTEGNSLDEVAKGGKEYINNNSSIILDESKFKEEIEGYTYRKATVGNKQDFGAAPNGKTIYRLMVSDEKIYYSTQKSGNDWERYYKKSFDLYMVYESDSTIGGESGATGDLAHQKYVTDNKDGTYGLTLDVTGAMGTETNPAKVDVVLLVDVSSSMDKSYSHNVSKIKKAKEAVKELTDTLDTKSETVDSKWKVVTFGKTGNVRTQKWVTADQAYDSVNEINIRDDVGTNYEDGFAEVASVMNGAREDAVKIVIFLTDGEPTLYGTDGDGPGNCTTQTIINRSAAKAAQISCSQFYAVGIGVGKVDIYEAYGNYYYDTKEDTTGTEILTKIKDSVTSASKKAVYNTADEGTDLTEIFTDIAGEIITYTATNVTITDTLTDEVDKVEPSALVVEITKKDGTDVTDEEVKEGNIQANYNEQNKQLTLEFDDTYVLKQDYTYSVTIQIKPNETAKKEYISNKYTYPDTGESGTGPTSAGKKGFFSNVENSAKVTWTTNGEKKEGLYNRPVVQLSQNDTPTPPPEIEKTLSKEKYVKDNKDGSYDLTLNVSGQVGSLSQKANVDIVLLIDVSSSMAQNSRIENAKKAVKELTDELKAKSETVDSRWTVVTFGKYASELTGDWTTAETANSEVQKISLKQNVGTNYEAGFAKTAEALSDSRPEAEKIVIFLTDGAPTYAGEDASIGNGGSTSKKILNATNNAASQIQCNQFYGIGIGIGSIYVYGDDHERGYYTTGTEILSDIAENVSSTIPGTVKNTTEIVEVFKQIAGSITSFLCSNVTITDTLSQWAEAADDSAKLEIKVIKKELEKDSVVARQTGTVAGGVQLTLSATEINKEAVLHASYNKETKQLKLEFPDDYQLEGDLTYYVTMKITPTVEAYQHYETNKSYPDVGDENTDAPDNDPITSSKKSGFYSNTEAIVTYKYNGEKQEAQYQKPVIQVKESSDEDNPYIKIEKIFEGINDPDKELNNFQIEVYSDESCSPEYLKQTLSLKDAEVEQNENKYIWKLDNLEAGTYYLKEKGKESSKYTVTTTVNGTTVTTWPVEVQTQEPTFNGVGELQIKHSCSNNEFNFLSNYNFIASSLKTDKKYFVWTETPLSVGEREAIKKFVAAKENSFNQIVNADAVVYFYSGVDDLKNGITINGGTIAVSDEVGGIRKLSFESGSNQWQHVIFGQYEKTNGYDAEISIINTYTENALDIDVEKCGEDYDTLLSGATFNLYQQNSDNEWELVQETDITDEVELNELNVGIYKLEEIQAPNGYRLLNEEIIFKVESQQVQLLDQEFQNVPNNETLMYKIVNNNNSWKIQVKNNKLQTLPSAGGPGIYWNTVCGMVLMMGAALIVYKQQRKREIMMKR